MKSRLFDSNLSLIEFIRNKRSVYPFVKPFFTLMEVARGEMRVLLKLPVLWLCERETGPGTKLDGYTETVLVAAFQFCSPGGCQNI